LPVKYRRKIFQHEGLDESLKEICLHEREEQPFEIIFHEIEVDLDHVHFPIQTVPTVSLKI
jgi:REP element-mobilizing transposase RayT